MSEEFKKYLKDAISEEKKRRDEKNKEEMEKYEENNLPILKKKFNEHFPQLAHSKWTKNFTFLMNKSSNYMRSNLEKKSD